MPDLISVILILFLSCTVYVHSNHYLTGALVIETAMALWLAYMPFIQHGFRVYPIRYTYTINFIIKNSVLNASDNKIRCG